MSKLVNQSGLARSWYESAIADFLRTEPETILGTLASYCEGDLLATQRQAWLAQIAILREQLEGLEGWLFFEFHIPRMGRRVDVILVVDEVLFVLEFKVGADLHDRAAREQVWDYALDLKNFHAASHHLTIVPILVATEARGVPAKLERDADNVYRPILSSGHDLGQAIQLGLAGAQGSNLDVEAWSRASYKPTPTIVEAARSLYAQHSVQAIECYDAGRENLTVTSRRVEELIEEAQATRQKFICFVTGVPGAGKTLVGLNVATRRDDEQSPTHAVFLSGNGPLVKVLCEALTRDEHERQRSKPNKTRKGMIRKRVESFIQNVHHFRDEGLRDPATPDEHVVIFDEAQRAWNRQMTANFMLRKKKRPGFTQSEPEFLISYMDRHQDWAVIICLVGGGQEINTGEAGIATWLEAVMHHFPHWRMFISSRLHDSEYSAGEMLQAAQHSGQTRLEDSLHLAVSMRSFRAENVSSFVKALLDCEPSAAAKEFSRMRDRYPVVLSRDLEKAKAWVRAQARGTQRYGLLASSKAVRLKPHALDIRVEVNPVHYFLNDRDDVRSSFYLEDAATEFQVQGLELDWACVTWDADFRFNGRKWNYHDFRGSRWTNIKKPELQSYLRNAYRVLLTRARQGMVVFVPPGDVDDPTRPPAFYDATFEYLRSLGIPTL